MKRVSGAASLDAVVRELAAPASAEVDLRGHTAVPVLIETHVHPHSSRINAHTKR